MKALLSRWGRRWIAGLLAIVMLSGMIPTALASETPLDTTSESETELLLEAASETTAETVPETTAETVPETTAETVPETTAETVPETTAETVPETTAETVPETTAETESEEELSEEELEELLLLEGGEMALFSTRSSEDEQDAPTDIITLDEAIKIAEKIAGEGKKPLYVNEDDKIIVQSSAGLILLSYVNPSEYCDRTINLSLVEAGIDFFNLVTPVKDTVEQTTTDENGTTDTTVTIMRYSFQGLGGTGNPFAGTIATSSPKPIRTARALFNNLSTTATLPAESNALQFEILQQAVDGPILATEVVQGDSNANKNWKIGLSGSASIGGIIGTMTGGTVTLEAELSGWRDSETVSQDTILTCTGNPNAGFFCNTMTADGSLTATLSGTGSVSVTAAKDGSAGGFVGYMGNGCSLTASIGENAKITGVTAESGSAGGLVGTAVNSVVATQTSYTLSDITVTGKFAGGLIGSCTGWNNATNTIDLSNFTFNDTLKLSGDTAGGVFGALTNSGETLTITTTAEGGNAITSTSTAATYGGLIGTYSASTEGGLKDSLEINSLTVNSSKNDNKVYGGIIGTVPSTCYVKMSGLTANTSASSGTFGGLVAVAGESSAVLLDVNGASVSSGEINGSVTGGLVGKLSKGVLRLDGTITVPAISAGEYKGRIVGENGDGLVYAVSTCALSTSGDASNIGNWGEVVRLGEKLGAEGTLFSAISNEHTLTINNPAASGGTYTLSGTADFAGYALAYNYGTTLSPVLTFSSSVSAADTVTLTGSVVLTGTGILSIGRDNGGSSAFTGTFDGGGYTITLDIGDTAGTLWARQKKSDPDSHGYLGLFAKVGGESTIQNVTVAGTVKMSVLNGTDGNANENPLRVAGLVAHQVGSVSYNAVTARADVTVDTDVEKTPYVMQAGMVAFCDENSTLKFTNCNWTSTLTNSRTNSNDRSGGFLAHTKGGITLTAVNCTLSGNISHTGVKDVARVGGLVADIEENSTGTSQITLTDLTVSANISAETAKKESGGLLGCHWYSTDVVFVGDGEKGVTVSGASLNAGSAKFGGLVYQATGHWDATANESIKFTGTDGKKTTITATTGDHRGLLVGDGLHDAPKKALYLEVGTWGGNGTAYWIDSSNVQLVDANGTPLSGQFDELVGCTTYAEGGLSGNDNAIVSLQTGTDMIDSGDTVPNTYTTQFPGTSYTSPQTRYYYNLSHTPVEDAGNLTSEQAVVTWSASQFAAENIRQYLCKNAGAPAVISDTIDLTHYSYYPVTPLSTVTVQNATLKFGYDTIQSAEATNKQPSDANHQHYLMQCGLLNNTGSDVTVTDTRFEGIVGSVNNVSGALIYGTVSGTSDSPTTVSLTRVTLGGLRVNDVGDYAPLLINKVGSYVNLTVDNLRTDTGYLETAEDGKVTNNTITAATSLIGNVGSNTATNLKLKFANIALDSRINAGAATAVNNNEDANYQVEYKTTRSIFTKATLLNCFQYSADSSGIYNFYTDSNMVTYGVESSKSIQNEGEQYEYYDGGYICDGLKTKPADDTAAADYFDARTYRPYVAEWNNQQNNRHELNVNKKPKNLLEGCGTYGDPYLIKDGKQLVTLAYYLNTATVSKADGFNVNFNTYVLGKMHDDGEDYHTLGGSTNDLEYVFAYAEDGGTWVSGDDPISADNARTYLLNAYYQVIQEDGKQIIIKANDYVGLGTQANPFSGVIVGKDSPTVFLNVNNSGAQDFGGLIRYSRGSVVKDLAVDYSKAQITMTNAAVTNFTNNPFFGGVVGYCMGGDTIIDNVSVNYEQGSVTLSTASGQMPRLIAAGGYVGLVGGAKDSDGYEKTGGGVVFRNMGSHSNNFASTLSNAGEESPTLVPNSTSYDYIENATELGCTYFFCNRYVGRVLDGYACYDNPDYQSGSEFTLNNTDKNYTIPDLAAGTSGLEVDENYNVTVNNAQDLWLLSAIVNSGAGAMDSTGTYQDVDNMFVDAYQTGKPRSGEYTGIGTGKPGTGLGDEAHWGGVPDNSDTRVSYLISFTDPDAAKLTGGGAANNPVSLTFKSGEINMTSYGNGFRGIGASYTVSTNLWSTSTISLPKNYRRALLVSEINADTTSTTTIKLEMSQREYHPGGKQPTYETGFWNQGAGLFTAFSYTSGAQVKNLTLSGTVCLNTFKPKSGTLSAVFKTENEAGANKYDICVGGFAGLVSNSSGMVSFTDLSLDHLNVYGGTTTGGVFGITSKSSLAFPSFTISTVNVIKTVESDGSVGGLVGLKMSDVTIGTSKTAQNAKTSTVDNLKVQMFGTKTKSQDCGGLIGCSDGGNLTIQNIQATNLMVHGEDTRDVGGLVSGFRQGGTLTISDCELTNLRVDGTGSSEKKVGGLVGVLEKPTNGISEVRIDNAKMAVTNGNSLGGLVGYTNQNITLDDCHISGSLYMSGKIKPYLGGMVGCGSDAITIKNCTETNLTILSGDSDAGGLVGQMSGGSTKASNVSFSNVKVVTKDSGKRVGLLTGHTNGKSISAYNILADSCTVGYNTTATMDNLNSIELSNNNNTGLWLGRSKDQDNKLVAVAVKGTNQPQKDVGNIESKTVQVTYADYPVVQTNKPTTGSASPWLDVNPKIEVGGLTLTGNGVGYHTVRSTTTDAEGKETTTSTNQSVAKTILEEVTKPNKRYFNLDDGDSKTFSTFLNKEEAAYLTTYQAEEGATTTATNVDFPILVLASNADADTVLWTYIAALTNVSSGTVAKDQASSVTAATYKWNGSAFVKQTSSSLTVNDKKISTVKNQYDNQDSRFTLLDVKYKNPTTTTTNAAGDYFHLYVPVLVKKVLQVKYSIKMLAGTNYCADVYSDAAVYATANFNEPVTALIEYNYDDRTIEDWNDALNNGEDLLWHYKKVFALKSSEIYDLPGGTRLTLVDVATGKAYFYTMLGSENNIAFDCEKKLGFSPLPICDYLVITVNNTAGTDATTQFVATTEEYATVKVGDVYYRPATTDEKSDSNIEKRYLKVERINTERYFLTIQVPETQGVSLINNLLDLSGSAMDRVGKAPPAVKTGVSQGRYVLYNGVEQKDFRITTARVDGSGTEMTGGDAIRVQLSSDLYLTEVGKARYTEGYKPVDLNHRFTIDLKKVVGGNTTESVLGVAGISWNYTVVGKDGQELGTSGQRTYTPGELDSFSVSSGSYFDAGNMVTWIEQYEPLTVKAEIILQYGNNVGSVFPARTGENSSDGSYVHAESRVANAESQLPITANKLKTDGAELYYCMTPSSASLTFDAIEFSGGEKTLQLGINSDDDYQPRIIQTDSIYDYSEVEPATISRAKHIRYTLELFQKQGNGLYNGDAVSPINDYLPIVRKAGKDPTSTDESKMTWTEPLDEGATCDSTSFDFVPLTGAAFEEKEFVYANYMIRLTAELLEEKQDNGTIVKEVLPGTLASDYIVYTNARVLQKIPDDTNP